MPDTRRPPRRPAVIEVGDPPCRCLDTGDGADASGTCDTETQPSKTSKGFCLDVVNGTIADGSPVRIRTCDTKIVNRDTPTNVAQDWKGSTVFPPNEAIA